MQKVVGKNNKKNVKLFALSTCIWCKKTKELFDSNSVEYEFEFVDECDGETREALLREMDKYNPDRSFPTIVIDGEVIIGFKEDKIKEKLNL